ncbi:trypsin-like peptidase domain-containing protein [Psychrobacter sp. HD31]|uniref:S1C family serine protease n=1 Tax=Psychrobacter sp. HD31 TaxID=3112003 RepID=UPI003DA2AF6B
MTKNNKKTRSLWHWIPCLLLVGIIAFFAWYYNNSQQQKLTQWTPPVAKADSQEETTGQNQPLKNNVVTSYHDAVAVAAQSVVNIYTNQRVLQNPYMDDPVLRRYFEFEGGLPQQEENSTSLGSGVIVSEDGYIVTNAHVIEHADEIVVALNDGRKSRAQVVGTDPESDLAVIQVDMTGLKPLVFRQKAMQVGDVVLAIGNPFGVGQTVTQGIISATGRTGLGVNTFEDFIQTDAAINPGNSGGALVDARGELIGINTMIFSQSGGSMGIGFAIPNSIVEQVMNALIEKGHVSRGWLGIEIQSQLKDPTDLEATVGVEVLSVVANGPAATSGLQIGDVIVNIDGKKMTDANTLVQYVARKLPNSVLNTQILRNGDLQTIQIKLAERPTQNELLSHAQDNSPNEPENSDNSIDEQAQSMANMSEEERAQLKRELLELLELENRSNN